MTVGKAGNFGNFGNMVLKFSMAKEKNTHLASAALEDSEVF
jgi:hypothetical protein